MAPFMYFADCYQTESETDMFLREITRFHFRFYVYNKPIYKIESSSILIKESTKLNMFVKLKFFLLLLPLFVLDLNSYKFYLNRYRRISEALKLEIYYEQEELKLSHYEYKFPSELLNYDKFIKKKQLMLNSS